MSNYAKTTWCSVASQLIGRLATAFLTGRSLPYLLFLMAQRSWQHLLTKLTSASNLSCNSTLDNGSQQLPDFQSLTKQRLSSMNITAKMVSHAIYDPDASKASGPYIIPAIVLKMCSPELSPVIAKLYNICLAKSCFPSCWKSSPVVPVFKNDGERSAPGEYHPVSLLPIISKIFKSFINDSLTKHLNITGLFSDLRYGLHASRSTADILTVLSERIYNSLDAGGETRAIALDISKEFDKVWHAGMIHKLKAYGVVGLILSILESLLMASLYLYHQCWGSSGISFGANLLLMI